MTSLGFATELAVLEHQGSVVERHDGGTVVRTPGNPGFRWGNFVLAGPSADPGPLAALHGAAFPDAGFTTVGVDVPHPDLDLSAWTAAGFEAERSTVLTADRLPPGWDGPAVRELRGDDWDSVVDLELEESADRDFVVRRYAARREAVAAGAAVWMGREADGRIVAVAGVIRADEGTARFQDVTTSAPYRRQGTAGALVTALARAARERLAARRLVIVADPDGPAVGLYRRLGFRDEEEQLQLERLDPGVGGPA